MWMPTYGHSSNQNGYNDRYRYNHKDCNRTPAAQATGLKDGKRQFHRNPWNWHLQSLRSVWDCQHHAEQPATFTPSHMERRCDRGSHRTNRTVPLRKTPVSNKITSRQNPWKNFLISCDALNAFGDAPTILMGKTLIQTPASRYQIKLWMAPVSYGSEDTYHFWY